MHWNNLKKKKNQKDLRLIGALPANLSVGSLKPLRLVIFPAVDAGQLCNYSKSSITISVK